MLLDDARVHPRDDPPTLADAEAEVTSVEGKAEASPSTPSRRRRPLLRRFAAGLLALVTLLVALAAFAYEFGSMEPPSAEMQARYDALVAAGRAAPVRWRFHVPIPGCRCHSADPVVQAQHENIPIRECSSCHGGGAQALASPAGR